MENDVLIGLMERCIKTGSRQFQVSLPDSDWDVIAPPYFHDDPGFLNGNKTFRFSEVTRETYIENAQFEREYKYKIPSFKKRWK